MRIHEDLTSLNKIFLSQKPNNYENIIDQVNNILKKKFLNKNINTKDDIDIYNILTDNKIQRVKTHFSFIKNNLNTKDIKEEICIFFTKNNLRHEFSFTRTNTYQDIITLKTILKDFDKDLLKVKMNELNNLLEYILKKNYLQNNKSINSISANIPIIINHKISKN